MMIHGLDTTFPVHCGADAIDFSARLVSHVWPGCVFVLDNDPTIHERLPVKAASEMLIYRDRAACDAWDKFGYDDSLRGTMVYLISEPRRLTVTTECDPSSPIATIVAGIAFGLSRKPFCEA